MRRQARYLKKTGLFEVEFSSALGYNDKYKLGAVWPVRRS